MALWEHCLMMANQIETLSYVSEEESVPIGHGLRSFLAGDDLGINKKMSFNYSISTDRNPVVLIGF